MQKEEERIPVRAVLFFEVGRAPHRHLFLAGPRSLPMLSRPGGAASRQVREKMMRFAFVELVLTVDHDVAPWRRACLSNGKYSITML